MDHQEALRRSAVEKYLLNEMPQPERDEFEEHFFGCQECAADLRATAAVPRRGKEGDATLAPPQACAERAQETPGSIFFGGRPLRRPRLYCCCSSWPIRMSRSCRGSPASGRSLRIRKS